MGFLDALFGGGSHRNGGTRPQSRTSRHGGGDGRGQPAPPRRVLPPKPCPCGKGKPVGHAGKCTIPTGTFRGGQRRVQTRAERTGRKPSTSDRYVKPMGRGI